MNPSKQNVHVSLPVHGPAPVVCRMLRSRGGHDDAHLGIDWRHGNSTIASYWCTATMENIGPDDHFAHAHECVEGRACFKKPLE